MLYMFFLVYCSCSISKVVNKRFCGFFEFDGYSGVLLYFDGVVVGGVLIDLCYSS